METGSRTPLPAGHSGGSIDDVVARMRAIEAELDPGDGVAAFNRLYLHVTEAVRVRKEHQSFESPGFLERLDVIFAGLYFDAYAASAAGQECPEAWAPLFDHRERPATPAIEFALAGMNAHINHDLPIAVVATCREMEIAPEPETPHGRDYHLVNMILRDVEKAVKQSFMTESLSRIDEDLGEMDDTVALWSLYAARRLAWGQAELLFALGDHAELESNYLGLLARAVGLSGRAFFV